jgi:hypothetical protein
MFRLRLLYAVFLCSVIAGVERVHADTITLTPLKDNTLYEDAVGAKSNGAGSAMFAGLNSQSLVRRALIAFDIAAAIPSQATINGVSLTLHNDAANDADDALSLHRILADWGEGASMASGGQGSGGSAAPGDATWLHTFFDTNLWGAPGGDFTAVPSATAIVGGPGAYTWDSTPALVSDAQSFLDGGSANFGWIILGNETAVGTAKRFATRESGDPLQVPTLTVDFTPVPEPAGGVLMTLAVAILARHRRPKSRTAGDE